MFGGVRCWFGISRDQFSSESCLKSRVLKFLEITFASNVHLRFLEMCFVFLEILRALLMFLEITCALWHVWLGRIRAAFVQGNEPKLVSFWPWTPSSPHSSGSVVQCRLGPQLPRDCACPSMHKKGAHLAKSPNIRLATWKPSTPQGTQDSDILWLEPTQYWSWWCMHKAGLFWHFARAPSTRAPCANFGKGWPNVLPGSPEFPNWRG